MPGVAKVGRTGAPGCGRSCESCSNEIGCTAAATGRDWTIAATGTTVAALRLTKFCTTVWLLVMLLTVVLVMTWLTLRMFVTLTRRT